MNEPPTDDQELVVVCNKIQIKDRRKDYQYSIIYNIKYNCSGNSNGIIYQCSQKAEMKDCFRKDRLTTGWSTVKC